MKLKHVTFILLGVLILQSCTKKPKKEVAKTTEKKEAPVKKKKVVEQPFVYGIDISSYQGDEVNFINTHKDSLGFVICKATQGAYFTDPNFHTNWPKIKKDGFIRGTYHFYMSKDNPITQANHFVETISSIENTDLAPIVDFENGGIDNSQSVKAVQNGLITFI
ncbi:MAG: hypothetical protein JKY02_00165, partial [Flavobacteriaceae bacterium]|nr:hypothetical protein [Flavobacteriaceae bacterium]